MLEKKPQSALGLLFGYLEAIDDRSVLGVLYSCSIKEYVEIGRIVNGADRHPATIVYRLRWDS